MVPPLRIESITIEEVPDDAPPEIIELVALDATSIRAVERLEGSDRVCLTTPPHLAGAPAHGQATPAIRVTVADLRRPMVTAALREVGSAATIGVLSIAVLAVDSLQDLGPWLNGRRTFEAVLPVVVPRGSHAEEAVGAAVSAICECATANRISLPCDALYPFFVGAGRLQHSAAEGADIAEAAAAALDGLRLRKGTGPRRMLMHIDTTDEEMMDDFRVAYRVITARVRGDVETPTTSVLAGEAVRRVSLLAATPE